MKFFEEVVVEEFLPTYRSLLVAELHDRGLTQRAIADAIGISQSAVSKHLHGGVARNDRVATDPRVTDTVERVAAGLAGGELGTVGALLEAEGLVYDLGGDLLAAVHAESVPGLDDHEAVRVHDPDGRLRERERVRASLRTGLRAIEGIDGVAALVPAVGTNLVACTAGADGPDDVAGVPGRIVAVRGRATVPADPAFGASEHVGGVLLAARRAGADAAAAVNLRYDPAILDGLRRAGATPVEFAVEPRRAAGDDGTPAPGDADGGDGTGPGPGAGAGHDGGDEGRWAAVEAAVRGTSGADVCYQTGAHGVEPIVYVLGPDVDAVLDRVRAVA